MVRIARRTLAVIALSVLAHHLNPALAATTAFSSAHCPTRVPSRLYSTVMSDNTTNPSSPAFLQDKISTLLASPHIHFNQPPQGAPFRIRMGHGPVDLFSTRFANYFTQDATGVVAGKEVDNDGLKRALLALQKKWNPDEADFVAQDEAEQVCYSNQRMYASQMSTWRTANHQVALEAQRRRSPRSYHSLCRVSYSPVPTPVSSSS
ncbi:hypothetical protein C8Q77DRAFT_128933 [Trametes polyzona]|nr:hypothetical protein C8Q77DRAFT_128933 [Trametes polyzona]